MLNPETGFQERESETRREIKRICEGTPDALYILSGISEKINPKTGQKFYKPGSYADTEWNGFITGTKARALAAVELAKYFPDATVVANSKTYNARDPEAPTDADVMREYMEQKSVEPERIIQQDRSTTTFAELTELFKYIQEYVWSHVVVVANEFQIERAKEMLKQIETLKDPIGAWQDPVLRDAIEYMKTASTKITFVSAEDVLPLRDKRYGTVIAKAKTTELWKKRVASEEKGIVLLKRGDYWK